MAHKLARRTLAKIAYRQNYPKTDGSLPANADDPSSSDDTTADSRYAAAGIISMGLTNRKAARKELIDQKKVINRDDV